MTYKLMSDNDGNWYKIPVAYVDRFCELRDDVYESEPGSTEWFSARHTMQVVFGENSLKEVA